MNPETTQAFDGGEFRRPAPRFAPDVLAAAPARPAAPRESLRETLESIIIALILAFVFRAFIVEAFIIPTGSMAPTLYGAHGTILCDNCGWETAYGLQDLGEKRGEGRVGDASKVICPNCSFPNSSLEVNDQRGNAESGDRILVLKWPYDIGVDLLGPARWDVTVFKNPADGWQNYIKRLVGLPNEVLSIIDGDVYTVPITELSPRVLTELRRRVDDKHVLLTKQGGGRLSGLSMETMNELELKLTIARKTPVAQKSLWFTVYDHDYPPRELGTDQPRWSPHDASSGWTPSRRTLHFEDQGLPEDYIELRGEPIAATYAYNVPVGGSQSAPAVSDLAVRFVMTPAGPGAVSVRLEKHDRVFRMTIHTDGWARLAESEELPAGKTPVTTESPPLSLQTQIEPLAMGRPVEIGVENVDYRLCVYVAGREVLATSTDSDARTYYGPDIKTARRPRRDAVAPPRVYAAGGAFELSHVLVQRDVYYYRPEAQSGWPNWAPTGGWGSAISPILLREGEFFMLGDNSAASQDSRLWLDISSNQHLVARGDAYQLGTVPRDQLVGKAFFVYWPMGHRIDWLPIQWGFVPDVGRMRWIR